MVRRVNHYEAAFEGYLRERKIPYVGVDEAKRSLMATGSIKSFDFIVSPADLGLSWLVDVKGRRFPSGQRKQYFKNWTTEEELRSLSYWQSQFGVDFLAAFVFAYHVVGEFAPTPEEDLFSFRGETYGFVAVRLEDYLSWSRTISPKWSTVAMPAKAFRQLARPIGEIFDPPPISRQPEIPAT